MEPKLHSPWSVGAAGHAPRIVALLRAPYLAALAQMHTQLRSDFPELRPAHFIVFQVIEHPPAGSRLTELAQRAQMTKPAMLEWVDALERGGYVERHPDPGDRRAKLIRLTPRGVDAYESGLQAVDQIEAAWAHHLGDDRFAQLVALLRDLAALEDGQPDAAPDGRAMMEAVIKS
jgi:DNA-binding MarR family transcriptional regulator